MARPRATRPYEPPVGGDEQNDAAAAASAGLEL